MSRRKEAPPSLFFGAADIKGDTCQEAPQLSPPPHPHHPRYSKCGTSLMNRRRSSETTLLE